LLVVVEVEDQLLLQVVVLADFAQELDMQSLQETHILLQLVLVVLADQLMLHHISEQTVLFH
jgi:hypothetical protein